MRCWMLRRVACRRPWTVPSYAAIWWVAGGHRGVECSSGVLAACVGEGVRDPRCSVCISARVRAEHQQRKIHRDPCNFSRGFKRMKPFENHLSRDTLSRAYNVADQCFPGLPPGWQAATAGDRARGSSSPRGVPAPATGATPAPSALALTRTSRHTTMKRRRSLRPWSV